MRIDGRQAVSGTFVMSDQEVAEIDIGGVAIELVFRKIVSEPRVEFFPDTRRIVFTQFESFYERCVNFDLTPLGVGYQTLRLAVFGIVAASGIYHIHYTAS